MTSWLMVDNSNNESEDEGEESGTVKEVTAHGTGTGTATAKATVAFSAESIQKRLRNEERALALVLTSTRLENIVSRAIRLHYGWSEEKFKEKNYDKKSLGSLLEECVEHGALKEHEDELNTLRSGEKQVVSLRNDLVHEYGYLSNVEEDEDVQQEVEDAVGEAIEFIETVEL